MADIKLVVLDMAGTTVKDEHEVEACFATAAKETGLDVSKETILAVQGWSKRRVFEVLWREQLGNDYPVKEYVDRSYAAFREILEAHYLSQGASPSDFCVETLKQLKEEGYLIGLTTGFYRKVTDIILEKLGWLDMLNSSYIGLPGSFIDHSIAGDEVEFGRPAPNMIFKTMERLHVDDANMVVNIGDTPSDLESGRNAGCALSLGVTNGTHSHEQLAALPNDGLLRHLGELPETIQTFAAC